MLFRNVIKGVLNLKRIITVFFIIAIVSGCSFGKVYTDAIEQTDEYLANEQFDEAYKSIQVALEEKPEDDVALNIQSGLLKYQEFEKYKETRDWDNVSKVIDSFGTLDSVHPKLKKQVDEIKKYMVEQVNLENQVSNNLEKIESNIDDHLFEEADTILRELEEDENVGYAKEEVTSMREQYEAEHKKFKEEEKKVKRKEKLDNLLLGYEKEMVEAEKNEKKMNEIKKREQEDQTLLALNKTETAYDDILNEVYQTIIKEFPKKENKLREVQREWLINYEDEVLDARYNYGEKKELETSIKIKKERTKELLADYF